MSTITKEFTKEQLIAFATEILKTEASMAAWDCMAGRQARAGAAIAEIALASLEAEPVAYQFRFRWNGGEWSPWKECTKAAFDAAYSEGCDPIVGRECEARALYTASPVPASVTDERAAFEAFMEARFKDTIDRKRVKNGDQGYFAWDMIVAWIVWQGRAAMLQGADGNSPVIPDGWALVPKEPTPAMLDAAWVSHGIYHASAYRTMLAAAPQRGLGDERQADEN